MKIFLTILALSLSSIAMADDFLTHLSRTPMTFELAVFVVAVLFNLIFLSSLHTAYRVRLARQKAEDELKLAHTVFENTSEAILVTDENICIITVNPAFTRTTGYSLEEVIGKNPSILSSGKQDKNFYEAMWHAISTTGQWQGEIWNRRKSGEEYVEWLTIKTIFHHDGSVHRRVALFSDITEKKNAEDLIWAHENYDLLTGLPNRRLLVDRMEQDIKKAERDHSMVAAMIIDIDDFNHINDSFGFQVGDIALTEIGKRIRSCVRDSDTISRSAGDEFIVILTGLNDAAEIGRISQDIIQALEKPFEVQGHEMLLSACIGAAVFPHDAQTAPEVLVAAGHAVKHAQHEGNGHFRLYKQSMQDAALNRMRLTRDLRQAVVEDQFQIFFQPIVELSSGRIHKAEALIRWIHPERGLISPADFIPVAEDTGAILQIGDWVFRQAANRVKRWRETIDPEFQISVNKSPIQFHDFTGQHPHWLDYLQELELPGNAIVVEITEGLLMDASGPIAEKLLHFSQAGVQVAIDDFGTGYSALSYLKKFDVDYLKIDQSFVRNLAADTSDLALCEAIVVMAHKLGLKVIAEGIETENQRDLLKDIGCDFGQGYLFSRPIPADEFEKLLISANHPS
jgi:diguanylate cyclase (GGDEF)-like protein/PAS domain S-box-containing protein